MAITVVNKKTHKPTANDIYIGRGSMLGNPFTHMDVHKTKAEFQCSTRDESIDKYGEWLAYKVNIGDTNVLNALRKIHELNEKGNVNLVCYCKPLKCHGDIIKAFIESVNW